MEIREGTVDEFAQIAALQTDSWQRTYRGVMPDPFLDVDLRSILDSYWASLQMGADDFVLVADQKGLQGFIAVSIKDIPYIENLHVSASAQSRGLGRRLMQAAAQRLIDSGYESLYLGVATDNQRAIRFYQELGGRFSDPEPEAIFGVQVEVARVDWTSLSDLIARSGNAG
ncbi:MAG: GNAT family N-acetyltransferase [Pseudomonadota bacterium]